MSPYQKYEMYKLIHLFGIFMTFVVLGGLGLHILNGGNKDPIPIANWWQRYTALASSSFCWVVLARWRMFIRLRAQAKKPPGLNFGFF